MRNKGLSCLPLLLSMEIVLFPGLSQNAFQYICNAAGDARMKLAQAAALKCSSNYITVQRKEKALQKYCLLLT